MKQSIVDRIYQDNLDLLEFLEEKNEPSFMVQFNTIFAKTMLLSAASYFEHEICVIIQTFIERKTENDERIISILKQKAIDRQYHTYFSWKEWEKGNANSFFSLFGEVFKERASQEIKTNVNLKNAVRDFLEIGNERNKLVHQNFANCILEKNANEVYNLYKEAQKFIDFLDNQFRNL
jgi:RiboL-PSP-HEPN